MTPKERYRFRAQDFYKLLEAQNYKCYFSGRTLTPENCSAIHIVPLSLGGLHTFDNIALVTDAVAKLKQSLPEDELLALCRDIIETSERKAVSE